MSAQQAAIAGTALGLLVVAAIFYVTFAGRGQNTPLNNRGAVLHEPGKSPVEIDPDPANTGQATPAKTEPPAPKEYVWIEDDPPKGVRLDGNTPWEFATKPEPVFSGEKSTRRTATDTAPPLTGGAVLSVQALDHVEHGRRVIAALPFLRNNSVDATDLHLSLVRKLNLTVQSEWRTRWEQAELISLTEDYEIAYWRKRFGVSDDRLAEAVHRVGLSAAAVEVHLKT